MRERISEPMLIGDIIDEAMSNFWKPNTKEEEAAKFNRGDVYTDGEGIVRSAALASVRLSLHGRGRA